MARSDKFTLTKKKQVLYRDFMNNLDKNPFTGYLGILENENAIKQALRNLFLTGEGERFMDSKKGGNIRHLLFENFDPGLLEALKFEMRNVIAQYEPRVDLLDILVSDEAALDRNQIDMTIVYKVVNLVDPQELTITVKRVR